MTIHSLLDRYNRHRGLRIAVHLLCWVVLWGITQDPDLRTPPLANALEWGYAVVSFYLLFYGAVPRWWAQRHYGRLVAVGFVLVLGCGWAMYWENRLSNPTSTYEYLPTYEAYGPLAIFTSGRYFFYAVFGGLIFNLAGPAAVKIAKLLFERQLVRQRLEQFMRRQQLEALLGQVSPHFLFNTLNNLYGLLLHDDPRGRTISHQLAALVRYCDELAGQPWVALGAEVQFIEDFLALARLRYGPQVRIASEWAVGAAAASRLPPLLLLPLVENACKHGLSQTIGAAWVHLRAQVQADELVFTVANSYADPARPTPTQPGGLGLATLRERLGLLYPGAAPLALHPTADAFTATLRLPLHPATSVGSPAKPAANPTQLAVAEAL